MTVSKISSVLRAAQLLAIASLVVACAARETVAPLDPSSTQAPARQPRAGAELWLLDAAESVIKAKAYRGGRLARLGHNHVIDMHGLSGRLYRSAILGESTLVLEIPVAEMVVDDPDSRAAAGDEFPGEISEKDKTGTRNNMLSAALLDAASHPVIQLQLGALEANNSGWTATMWAKLKTNSVLFDAPVEIESSSSLISVKGDTSLTHAALGLEPFSVALGALQVEERIDFSYDLRFVPAKP